MARSEHEHHAQHEHDCKEHGNAPIMCSCDHNPGGECHCPPNECKCDQTHHLIGEVQVGHDCCEHGKPHQLSGAGDHDMHDMHAGHDMQAGHAGHEGHAGHDHSHHDPKQFRNQFWLAMVLTIPTMVYSPMFQHLLGFTMPTFVGSAWIPPVLGTILLFTSGRIFLTTGLQEVKSRQPGMMALIGMALVVAFGYSLYLSVATTFGFAAEGMDFWWELAALISIMLLGHWIEMSSVMSAQNAVGQLAKLIPDTATLLQGKAETQVAVSSLKVGDLILVRAGATIPIDGEVVKGTSTVNEALLTGESKPVAKAVGDFVIGGTVNAVSDTLGLGGLTIRVTAVGGDTVISSIGKLVAQAQAAKSKTQRLADRAAGWLFYVALGSAVVTAIAWAIIGGHKSDFVLERIVTVLVIACPHALGLAIPLVTAITTARAARNGILIRDRVAFEATRKIDIVVFDKTGTLTTGERNFAGSYRTLGGGLESDDELLALAAGIEAESEHSLATAILGEAKRRKVDPLEIKDLMTVPGMGVSGRFEEYRVFAGGPAMLTRQGIDIDVQTLIAANNATELGQTVVFIVRDQYLLGFIAVGDTIRESSKAAVARLKEQGKRVAMLTGDASGVANAVAAELGIDEVFAEVLPHQKADVVAQLQATGATVAMVGDGVNDAPALAGANVGIAIGAGTDVAIDSAGLVLISNDPMAIPNAIDLAKRSYSKMIQNLFWAAGYNILAIPLAAGAFLGIGLVLSPALGAVLMSLSTIIVAANAQLLRR